MNLKHIDSERVLFLDIETAGGLENFSGLDPQGQKLWEKRAKNLYPEESPEESWEKAGLSGEFGRVVCISAGLLYKEEGDRKFRVKAYSGLDECEILDDFGSMLRNYYNRKDQFLCAHNGKGFDFPFLCKRFLVHGLDIPEILDVTGKKPWEVSLIDTMDLWKFGSWKGAVSLETLAWLFGIPSPKDDIDGSEVDAIFWKEKDLDRIVRYCNKDVITLLQVYLKLKREEMISAENIFIADQ